MAHLDTGFPGANPCCESGVRRLGKRHFVLAPYLERGAGPAYKFRLDARLVVEEPGETVRLEIDWNEPRYMHLRQSLYHCCLDSSRHGAMHGPGGWKTAKGLHRGGRVVVDLELGPGRHHVCQQPRYDLADLAGLVHGCRASRVVRVVRMQAAGGMPVPVFWLESGRKRPVIVVTARIHPYETAGSHCCHGVVAGALVDGGYRDRLLGDYDWAIVPVASPDGVAAGNCRFSGRMGLGGDASREAEPGNPLLRLVGGLAREGRLAGYLDIHNWMHHQVDGISCRGRLGTLRFVRAMRRSKAKTKPWRKTFHRKLLARRGRGVMAMAATAGANCLALEYPWAGRSADDMAELGRASLESFAGTLRTRRAGRRA